MHDFAYWKGGHQQQRVDADNQFKLCVEDRQGNRFGAFFMWVGVRAGGTPYLPTPFRWGYGWPYFRGYQTLTPDELKRVKVMFAE